MATLEITNLLLTECFGMVNDTFSDSNIRKALKTQYERINFVPIRSSAATGLNQSLNIKFGNFLENVYKKMLEKSSTYTLVKSVTSKLPLDDEKFCKKVGIEPVDKNYCQGGESTVLLISERNNELLDNFIKECLRSDAKPENLKSNFDNLVAKVKENIKEEVINPFAFNFIPYKNDVDLFFFNKTAKKFYYFELKKEDNHDSDKTNSMYKKALKTYLCMLYQAYVNEDPTIEMKDVHMSLTFFGKINVKSKILPEEYVFSGKQFFDKYMEISYEDFVDILNEIRNSKEMEAFMEECTLRVLAFPDEELEKIKESLKKSA